MAARKSEVPEEGGRLVPMHSDARIAPKIERAVTTFENLKTMFSNTFVLDLIDRQIELLNLVRVVKDPDQIETAVTKAIEALATLESFFSKLPVAQPQSAGDVDALAEALISFFDQRDADLHHALAKLAGENRELKRVRDEQRQIDRKNLNRLDATLGGRIGRLTDALSVHRGQLSLIEDVSRLTREKLELERRLAELSRASIEREAGEITALIAKLQHMVLLLDVGPEEDAAHPPSAQVASNQELSDAIKRQLAWFEQCGDRQADAESVRDEVQTELDDVRSKIKFGADEAVRGQLMERERQLARELTSLNAFIEELVRVQTEQRRAFEPLKRFREAFMAIRGGLTPELQTLIAKPLPGIPEIPELPTADSATESVDDEDSQVDAGTAYDVTRRSALDRIAAAHGLKRGAVLFLTLYEVLPLGRVRGSKGQRGLLSVASAARNAGLLRIFGPGSDDDVWAILRGTGEKSTELFKGFLTYRGAMRGRHMYARSDDQLPWRVGDLFTAEEIKIFEDGILSWKREGK